MDLEESLEEKNQKNLEEYKKLAKENFETANKIASEIQTSMHLRGEITTILFEKMMPSFRYIKEEK